MSLLVICPSRGRPANADEVVRTFLSTYVDSETRLIFVVDSDDPTRLLYPPSYTIVLDPPPGNMNAALNRAAADPALVGDASVVGFIGDDHRFRTPGWDAIIVDYLAVKPGVAYGADGWQNKNLPTNWFVSRRIVDAFGMGLPSLRHLWIDNYWKELASRAGCLYYMPDLLIEHMHPFAKKAPMDEGYLRVNSEEMTTHDQQAFLLWYSTQMEPDVAKLAALL